MNGIQEVSGSIPLISTKNPENHRFSGFFFFAFLVELLLIIGVFLIGNFDDADCGKASRLTVSCRMES